MIYIIVWTYLLYSVSMTGIHMYLCLYVCVFIAFGPLDCLSPYYKKPVFQCVAVNERI